jgi:1-acyl-sn-glycerol-3-phosphate acyltransferase
MIGNFFYRFLRYLVQWHFHAKYKFKVYNKEKLPKKYRGGYIIACNHQKYADPPAISAVVKGRFSFMAKSELFEKNPFFTLLIRMCGAFPVVRGANDNSAIDRAISDLKKGRIFVIFPEGTRSKNGTIGRAKSGVALIAATANVPVLPVCIMYGLGGKKNNLDFAVGDIIPPEEITVTDGFSVTDGLGVTDDSAPAEPPIDRKALKRVSERIIGSIKDSQTQILNERGESLNHD